MYSIPEEFDIMVWNDATLEKVSFGANTIVFHFDRAPGVQTDGPLGLSTETRQFYYDEIFPVQDDMGLLRLLGQKVTLVSTDEERKNLSLEFENGYTLELLNNPEYESYFIQTEEGQLVM